MNGQNKDTYLIRIDNRKLKTMKIEKEETEEYIPFGIEWEKEMSKLPKAMIIQMLKKALIELGQTN